MSTVTVPIEYTAQEGPQYHKRGEGRVYTYDVANKTSSTPSNITVTVVDVDTGTDYTSTWIPTNSPTASGTVITLSEVQPLTSDDAGDYLIVIQFDAGGYAPTFEYIELYVW